MNRIVISCLLATAFGVTASAQQPRQPRVVPAPPNIIQPGNVSPPGQDLADGELPHNVKLHLGGSVFGLVEADQAITTGGRDVVADLVLGMMGEQPVMGTLQVALTPGEPWLAAISLGVRCPIPAKNGGVEYRDLVIRTTVRIAPGKKVVLWQKGDQKLTLSMDQEKE